MIEPLTFSTWLEEWNSDRCSIFLPCAVRGPKEDPILYYLIEHHEGIDLVELICHPVSNPREQPEAIIWSFSNTYAQPLKEGMYRIADDYEECYLEIIPWQQLEMLAQGNVTCKEIADNLPTEADELVQSFWRSMLFDQFGLMDFPADQNDQAIST